MNKGYIGYNYNLQWTSQNLPNTDFVSIALTYTSGASWSVLNSQYPNTGSYLWLVSGTPGQLAELSIADWQQPEISGVGGFINITSGAPTGGTQITGTLISTGQLATIINIEADGSTVYYVYVDSSNSIRTGTSCLIPNIDGSLPIIMSGCTIVE